VRPSLAKGLDLSQVIALLRKIPPNTTNKTLARRRKTPNKKDRSEATKANLSLLLEVLGVQDVVCKVNCHWNSKQLSTPICPIELRSVLSREPFYQVAARWARDLYSNKTMTHQGL
jgi:hypothetical protein